MVVSITEFRVFFITGQHKIYKIGDCKNFLSLYANKSPTLLEGSIARTTHHAQKRNLWEFLVHDIIILKSKSYDNMTLDKRLQVIGNEIILPFRRDILQHFQVPFQVRGKFTIKAGDLRQIFRCWRFSKSQGKHLFKDQNKEKIVRTDLYFVPITSNGKQPNQTP
eukprot:UN31361